jgi:hypothetical protein
MKKYKESKVVSKFTQSELQKLWDTTWSWEKSQELGWTDDIAELSGMRQMLEYLFEIDFKK